jgi:UDP-glucose 4-epimerase
MKRVLITGKKSYIGVSTEKWLNKWPEDYEVKTLDMLNDKWKTFNFSTFDVVFHVAGIAHKKNIPNEVYERVNHVLAVEVAKASAEAGVRHFIFMSSGAVFAQSDCNHAKLMVDSETPLNPSTCYGRTKMLAENDISKICAKHPKFKVAILRPPTVYGKGAKGNYILLSKLAQRVPIFPYVDNKRSMIYIDNFCEFVRLVIDNESNGVFLPQNKEYVNTTFLVKQIAAVHGKRIYVLKNLGWLIRSLGKRFDVINKIFGTFYYDEVFSRYFSGKYQIVDFFESIRHTELGC